MKRYLVNEWQYNRANGWIIFCFNGQSCQTIFSLLDLWRPRVIELPPWLLQALIPRGESLLAGYSHVTFVTRGGVSMTLIGQLNVVRYFVINALISKYQIIRMSYFVISGRAWSALGKFKFQNYRQAAWTAYKRHQLKTPAPFTGSVLI